MGLIGALGGGLLGGIAGLFAGPAPTYKNAQFNNDVDLNESNKLAGRSASDMSAMSMEGAKESGQGLMGSPEQRARADTALGGATPTDLQDAIARRSQKTFDRDMTALQRKSVVSGVDQAYKNKATNFALNQAKQEQDQYQRKVSQQVEREKQAAAFSVLGNLTQGVGAMAGAGVAKIMKTNPVTSGDGSFNFQEGSAVPTSYNSKFFGKIGED